MTRLVKSILAPTVGTPFPVVTRSGATATRVNERGLMEICPANTPRFDYDPVTKACKGLLIETASTNLCVWSQTLANWGGGFNSLTITSGAFALGALSLDLLNDPVATSTSSSFVAGNSIGVTLTGNAVKAFSFFAKQGTSRFCCALLFDSTASVSRVAANITWTNGVPSVVMGVGTLLAIEDWGLGVYRFLFRSTSCTAANANTVNLYPANDGSFDGQFLGSTYFGGVQVENQECPSSYIQTPSSSTVTRNGDVVKSTALAGWFNAVTGGLHVEYVVPFDQPTDPFPRVAGFNDNTSNNRLVHYLTKTSDVGGFSVNTGAAVQADLGGGGPMYAYGSTVRRQAAAWGANDFALSVDGASVSIDSSGTIPTVTQLELGGEAGSPSLNGYLRRLRYFDRRIVNADLIALSSGGTITTPSVLDFDFTGGALEAQTGPLGKPRIAWSTYTRGLSGARVVASSADALFPSDAPLRPETYEGWKPTAAAATWRVDFGSVLPVQYFLIVGSGTKVAIEVSQDASVWSWICGALDLDLYASGATLVLLPTVMARYARVTMEQIGTMNVFMAGPILSMERYVLMGFQPINLSRETEKSTSDSRSGQFLGTTIRRMGFKAPVAFQSLTPSWVRANLLPFVDAARLYPYGFAWNPADFPEDVVYGRTTDDIAIRYMGDRPLMEGGWTIEGFDA